MLKTEYSTLILISGPPRSGTTWLNRELCVGREMFPFLPECSLITQQIELYSRTINYCDAHRFAAYFADEEGARIYYRENVGRLIDMAARLNRGPEMTTLVLKDPGLSLYLKEAKAVFPPHKLVLLMRDPRDVMASLKRVVHRKQVAWDMEAEATQLFDYYFHIGNYQQQADQDTLLVRYEDLVSGNVDALQQFLLRPVLQNEMKISEVAAMQNKIDKSDPFFSEMFLEPTTQSKIGSYREILSKKEIEHMEAVYAGVLQRWSYL